MTERRQSGFYMKNWHLAIVIILLLGTMYGNSLFAQKKGQDVEQDIVEIKKVNEKMSENCNNMDKRIEVERAERQGEYKILNKEIDNLNKKMDKVIQILEKIDKNAVIITSEIKE